MLFLFGLFPLLYVALGLMMFSGALGNGGPSDPPPELGLIFVAFGSLGSLMTWVMGPVQFVAAFVWTVFHILVITLQAFIFMTLTIVYLSMAAEHH